MKYDVFGMCNPLFDIQAEVSDSLIGEIGLQKGAMQLIDADQQQRLVERIASQVVNAQAGGSGANTMIGVAMLGGTACYAGKLGADEHGGLYTSGLESCGVRLLASPGDGPTGISVILVTPDAERTMCTHLGICRELSPSDIDTAAIAESRYLYVTGYLWDTESQKAAVLHAMNSARTAGVKVALSLSDPFCVGRHKEDFLKIVREHVDILIGNGEEAMALTDTGTPEQAAAAMLHWCEVAVITLGARGSILGSSAGLIHVPAHTVVPVDSTGAGDMFAAGLLYGLTQGLSLEECGQIASCVAAQVVGKLGPRLERIDEGLLSQACATWRGPVAAVRV